ncbi:glutamate racemase [Limnobacter parvus]|uniref:Glutamate racemase n=1 Tax=Limnobacter parvus TaxID=2939690 RepID=A0ABT1XG51_9BURK|nr:glutamate racemase [Limnobacter parvus]MCR2746257.1 glutamate racemase [Limnobacter parvus]
MTTEEQAARVGVFDSGVGGLSVLQALLTLLPEEKFDFVADERYLPYGDKPQHEIIERVLSLSNWLRKQGCKAMVVACNTATAAGASQARAMHANWPIVGIEPAVKPASLMTQTGVVGILATTNTVASERFKTLVERFDPLAQVIAQPCPGLVQLIETTPMPHAEIEVLLKPVVDDLLQKRADVIVLGCTHYPFVADIISRLAGPGVSVIETGMPVARQLKARLESTNSLNTQLNAESDLDRVRFYTTGDSVDFKRKLLALLGPVWAQANVEELMV